MLPLSLLYVHTSCTSIVIATGEMPSLANNTCKKAFTWSRRQFFSISVRIFILTLNGYHLSTFIAALHSQLGAKGERLTEQEIKEACTHFQCAAGVLVYLYVRWYAIIRFQ